MTSNISSNNKTLAKNTLFLYFRMLLTMLIGLYTSRVVINVLGISDYGIYNVIGGIVAIFASLNGAMASASSRYITFYIGRNDQTQLKHIFSILALFHIFIAVIILLLCETIGLWFFYEKMQIPSDRMNVAFWLLQFSYASAFLSVINTPYTSLIVGREKMDIYAYISVFDSLAKLIIVLLISYSPIDKLLFYGFFLFVIQFVDFILYRVYCRRRFPESIMTLNINRGLVKEIICYSGWSLFGNLAFAANTQGVNLLLNMFFGPVVNAARGVAVQVNNLINSFVSNYQMALNPQIVKNFASENFNRMHTLMFASARYGYFLLFFIMLPIFFESDILLKLWLKIVPEDTVVFLRLILCTCLINCLANSWTVAAGAIGKVKKLNIIVGSLLLAVIPISYIFFKMGFSALTVFLIHLVITFFCLVIRVLLFYKAINMKMASYVKQVIIPIFCSSVIALVFPFVVYLNMNQSWTRFFIITAVSFFWSFVCIWYVGLKKEERSSFLIFLKKLLINHTSFFKKMQKKGKFNV